MPWQNFNYSHWLKRNTISPTHCLHPVYEAVENAFFAVEESKRADGRVVIQIHRYLSQRTIPLEDEKRTGVPTAPIAITIEDNGIGFNDENWDSFETICTAHKDKVGGKGMGRLSYLLTFKGAEFQSCYKQKGKFCRREFNLSDVEAGTSYGATAIDPNASDTGTTLRLNGLRTQFYESFPKKLETIAARLVVHFFSRFSLKTGIPCILKDDWDDKVVNLRDVCQQDFILQQSAAQVDMLGRQYTITHVRARKRVADKHVVHLLGNGRVVMSRELPSCVTVTKDALGTNGDEFFYSAFVESDVLDARTNTERWSFHLDETSIKSLLPSDEANFPSIQALLTQIGAQARLHLHDILDPLEAVHKKRIEEFCRTNVIYRPLLKHRLDQLMKIPVGLNDEDFQKAVSGTYFEWKTDVRSRFNKMTKTVRENREEIAEHRAGYQEILRSLSELAYHELASYVIDRRAVIDFLDDKLRMSPSGRFEDEDAIHDIFYPRKKTSEDIAWDESNLWLIDERLAYQQFVASDIPWKSQGLQGSTSADRPDIATYYDQFYDATFAFAEGESPSFTSVTLIEFKRPERKTYTESENPVRQVIRYITEIRTKKAVLNNGHMFKFPPSSPINVHVICHIVEELDPYLLGVNFMKTPDGQGIIFHLPAANAIVQFTTFEKLIADAKKRNEIFFHKLGVDEVFDGDRNCRR